MQCWTFSARWYIAIVSTIAACALSANFKQEKEWCDEYKSCTSIGVSFSDSASLPGTKAPSAGADIDGGAVPAKDPNTTEEPQRDGSKDEPDIAVVCASEHVSQFGALECSNACQPVHCCFSGEYRCEDVRLGHLICDDYSQCGILYSGQKTSTELFEMAKQIDEVCDEDNVSTSSGRSECQELCKGRLCCFDDGREYFLCLVTSSVQGIHGDVSLVFIGTSESD